MHKMYSPVKMAYRRDKLLQVLQGQQLRLRVLQGCHTPQCIQLLAKLSRVVCVFLQYPHAYFSAKQPHLST